MLQKKYSYSIKSCTVFVYFTKQDGSGVVFFCAINQSASDVPGYTDCQLKTRGIKMMT